jgi:hypothetical protein
MQSLRSSWGLSWVMRAVGAVFRWFGRHRRPRQDRPPSADAPLAGR